MKSATIRLKRPRDPLADKIAETLAHLRNAKFRRCIIGKVTMKERANGNP